MPTEPTSRVLRRLRQGVLLRDGGPTDGQLLDAFVGQRDESAFAVLVRRHGPMVLAVCRRIVGHAQDAEDAFQATFLVLVRKAGSVSPREQVGNWLYGVACRTALKARSTAARRRTKEKQVDPLPQPARDAAEAVAADLQPLIDRELSRLPDKYRGPIVLCDLEGRAHREVARELRLPVGTLGHRLTAARRLLARRLARHGWAPAGLPAAAAVAEQTASATVPAALMKLTIRSATAAGGAIAAPVAAVTDGVMRAMSMSKLTTAAAVVFAAGVFGTGFGFVTLSGWRPGPTAVAAAEPQARTPPETDGANAVDELIRKKLNQMGAKEGTSDAEFLRRAFLDLTGTLPSPLTVQYFLTSDDAKKRERLIEALLRDNNAAHLHWKAWVTTREEGPEQGWSANFLNEVHKFAGKQHLAAAVNCTHCHNVPDAHAKAAAEDHAALAAWFAAVNQPAKPAAAPAAPKRLERLLDELLQGDRPDKQVLEGLCAATLGRLPTRVEAKFILADVSGQKDRKAAFQKVLKVLISTEDFAEHADALAQIRRKDKDSELLRKQAELLRRYEYLLQIQEAQRVWDVKWKQAEKPPAKPKEPAEPKKE